MKKKITKALSVMLAVVLTLTAAPLSGFVGLELPDWLDVSINASAATYTGTCGENVIWSFDESTGSLTISGTGEMDEDLYWNCPWEDFRDCIKTIIINEGVTTIGDSAFSFCSNLTDITIPDSVSLIENGAFLSCTSLVNFVIPDSVTTIGYSAFQGCSSLVIVTIPDSVISLGNTPFEGCSSLVNIDVSENNTIYSSQDGVLFNKGKTELIHYPAGKTATTYVVPDSVLIIKDYAFADSKTLDSVTISNKVTSIGEYAFAWCDNLTSVTIPDGVITIGAYAFVACDSLLSISIPDSVTSIGSYSFCNCKSLENVTIGSSVTAIGSDAFYSCDSLLSISIPDSATSIGSNAFGHCDKLSNVIIGNGVTTIGNEAFCYCVSLSSVKLGDSVTNIGNNVFGGCETLNSIDVSSQNEKYLSEDGVLFSKDKTILIQYPAGKTANTYEVPSSVIHIDEGAFSHCDSLTSITIPDSVTTIGSSAFKNCDNLENITIPNSVSSIGSEAFYSCESLTSITIPDSVTTIGGFSFICCYSLESITIGKNVNTIGVSAFYNTAYYNDETNWENDVLYIGNYLIAAKESISGEYKIKEETSVIAYWAFYGCSSLTSIIIPNGITAIDYYLFYECSSLTSVTIPDSITFIDYSAFEYCDSLTDVYYSGTEEQWKEITIDDYNECLTNATIHYNSTGPDSDNGICSKCGGNYNVDSETVAPTCSTDGYIIYTCTSCGNTYTEYVGGLGHNMVETTAAVAPTCEAPGITAVYTCANGCGKTEGGEIIDALGHDYSVFVSTTASSCLTAGTTTYACANGCGTEITVTGAVGAHTEVEIPADATCEAPGSTAGVRCSLCGAVLEEPQPTEALGHDMQETTAAVEPTCATPGSTAVYTCVNGCGRREGGETISATGHSYNSNVTAPTCTKQGYTTYTCSVCYDNYTSDYIDALGHKFIDGVCEYCGEGSENPSGTCGENITWTFDPSTGTLTISGTGEIESYWDWDEYPWKTYKTDIISIVINDGITILGEGAFAECTNLTSVTLPDSVTALGEGAFGYCESLTGITIPDGVVTIGDYAFLDCTSLRYASIGNSVKTIGEGAFAECFNLENVIIPDSVETIKAFAFAYCNSFTNISIPESVMFIGVGAFGCCENLTDIFVDSNNEYFSNDEYGVLYNKDKTTLVSYPAGNINTEYALADSVTTIGISAFVECCNLSNITIPNSVIAIGEGAFAGCRSLTTMTLPDSITKIDSSVFYRCTSLTSVTLPDSVTSIDDYAFQGCTSLTDVYYSGTEEEWNNISVKNYNDPLLSATIYYNYHSHIYEANVIAPTCTEQGYTTYTCSVCDDSYTSDYTEALGHTEAEAVEENYLAPTCTEKGSKELVVYCSVCGEEISRETIEIEALGHTYESTVIAPTCTEQGYTKYTCSVCDNSYNENYTEAYGHNYNSTVVTPNCTEDGYTIYTCSACNDSYMSDYVAAYGHNYDVTVVEATCTTQGYTKHVCSNCRDTYTDNYVDERGHYYTATVTKATCTKQGYILYVCSTCNDSYKDSYVEALGHNLSDWEIIKSATILNEGERTRSCSACDYSEKEILDRIIVDINSNENYGQANFTVVNAQTLEPIKNANIFVSTENDGENTFTTDANGKVSIILPVGKQNISVYADGCLTRNLKITVSSGSNNIPQIGLSDKPVYEAEITSKEMTIEEIEAAGIDTSDPSNKHVYKYELKLEFKPEIDYYSIFYYMNDDDEIVGGGGTSTNSETSSSSTSTITWVPGSTSSSSSGTDSGGYFFIPATESEPSVKIYPVSEYFYLIIRGEVTWLKEMFDVEMLIINNSLTDTLEDLTATLSLPDGLSLAAMTGEEQTLAQTVESIAGEESKSVHWYVRGDKAGSYNLEARLQGMVMPFEEPIDDIFVAENQINVWAGDAMHLDFEFPNAAYYGEDYPITITLTNVSDKTLYNVHHMVQIEQGMEIYYSDGTSKTKVEKSNWESKGIDKFNPGDKIVIETSVNIFFESEIMERELEKLIGIVDGIEQLINGFKAVQAGLDIAGALIDCVGGCVSALDDFNFSSGSDDDKLELFKELYDEISDIYTSYGTSGNETFDAAAGVFNSGLNASLNAITSDPDEWLQNHSVEDIEGLLKDVKSLGNAVSSDSGSSKKFNIFDSIRTAISAIPIRFALQSVIMTEDENNTTSIPWSYTVSQASPQYFGVSNVSKYLAALTQAAMGEVYDESTPWYVRLIPGLDDPFNTDEAIAYIQATEKEIAQFKAKDATGDVTFTARIERNTSTYSSGNNISDDFIIECDNNTAVYENGVLTFTGDGTISVTPQNKNGGILYIEDSKGNTYTYVINVVEEHECSAGEMEIIVAPTAEYDGFAVKCCEICEEIIEIIPLTYENCCEEHTFTNWTTVSEATETESGITTRNCNVCGYTEYQFVDYEEHTHNYGDWNVVNEANCTETGTKTRSCTDCGEKEIVTITALGHDYAEEWTVDVVATCKTPGSQSHHCTRCDAQTDVTEIPVGEHTLEHVIVDSSCSVAGIEYDICLNCQEIFNYTVLGTAEHSYGEWITETEASCTNEGTRIRSCSVCGTQETETIPSIGHISGDVVVENEVVPSCTSNGSYDEVVYCTVCNTELSRNAKTVEKIAHTYTPVVTAPTCTTNGYTTYTCVCGDTYTSDEINALGHNEVVDEAVEATCTEAGLTEGSHCDVCGETLVAQEELSAIGHQFSEWIETIAPSYLADGEETIVCSICNESETRPIEALIPDKTYSNEETDVSISVSDETYSGEIEVNVTPIYDGESYQVINSEIGNFSASIFDITTTIDGEKVQPEGKVLVKMPIPAGYNPAKIVVYYIPNDGSVPEKMDIIIEGSYILFETDHFSNYAIIDTSETTATISIQSPSRTEIRNNDGIILHANVEGNAPNGSYVRWESSNGNFDKSADGSNLKIIAKNKGYTTFTAILYDADGNELVRDTVEMYSKSGFFDKIGGFFRSLFGTTKIYES